MFVFNIILSFILLVWTFINIIYVRKIRNYTDLLRRGLVRIKIKSLGEGGVKVVTGWAYKVDIDSILRNPVSSSSILKVYVKGQEVLIANFPMVKSLEILEDSFVSVILNKDFSL